MTSGTKRIMPSGVWGTTGAHIANMVNGVVQGFKKQLEVNGVGYRAAMQGEGREARGWFFTPRRVHGAGRHHGGSRKECVDGFALIKSLSAKWLPKSATSDSLNLIKAKGLNISKKRSAGKPGKWPRRRAPKFSWYEYESCTTERRRARVRARVSGTAERPRLNVHRGLRGIFVQLIDDTAQKQWRAYTVKLWRRQMRVSERGKWQWRISPAGRSRKKPKPSGESGRV